MVIGRIVVKAKHAQIAGNIKKAKKLFDIAWSYTLCEEMQLIQGIDMCVNCEPEKVVKFINIQREANC